MGCQKESKDGMSLKEISDLFEQAQQIDDPQRQRDFVENACQGQLEREQLIALLNAHRDTCNLIDSPDQILQSARELDETELVAEGDRIGPYRLLQKIGEGGMGNVFMADQLEPIKRRVAIKVIKPVAGSQHVMARFEAEREALSRLDHPNITRILDAGMTENGVPYFVMELVCGDSLIDYCDRHKLDVQDRIALLQKVCSAVHHAHQKGILHRDIKPSNVMVTVQDGEPIPKVIDFGIAKALDRPLTEQTLFTRYGEMVGTPQYMSPEQAEQSGLDLDIRTDIYSLGVLLYELLTGTTPIESGTLEGKGLLGILETVRDSDSESPSCRATRVTSLNRSVADCRGTQDHLLSRVLKGELDWITLKAIAKVRSERYESAAAMAADMERYLQGEPVLAAAPTFLYLAQKMFQRHRAICLSLMVCAGLLFAATVAAAGWAISNHRLAEKSASLVQANEDLQRASELASEAKKEAIRLADEKKHQAAYDRAINRHLLGSLDGLLGRAPVKIESDVSDVDLVKGLGSVLKELGGVMEGAALEGGSMENLESRIESMIDELQVEGQSAVSRCEVGVESVGVWSGGIARDDPIFVKLLLEELHREFGKDHLLVASALVRYCNACLGLSDPPWSEIEGRARESLSILDSKQLDTQVIFLMLQSQAALACSLTQQSRGYEADEVRGQLLPFYEQHVAELNRGQRDTLKIWFDLIGKK